MMLPRGLKRGVWLELDQGDIDRLTAAAGVYQRAERPAGRSAPGRGGKQGPQGGRNYGNPAGSRGDAPAVRRGSMFGTPATKGKGGKGQGAGGGQPDPLKTSLGYIGQDALQRQREQGTGRGGPGGTRRRGGSGGGRAGGR